MATPLYRDRAGPEGSSSTFYGTGDRQEVTAKNWPVNPTRYLDWSVSLQKEPLRRKEEAERNKEETERRMGRKVKRKKEG